MMKKLINSVDQVVVEQLQGMAVAHPELRVNFSPHYICRAEKGDKVAIVSGGGSGHEPMHGGFVGYGMLDGACPGEVFTSPTPDQMYECAKAVNNGKGVLFLVKNYTGDVMNFEMAAELAAAEGIPIQSILVDDDVAVKDSLYTAGRRGVGLTVLMEKIVGAAAEAAAPGCNACSGRVEHCRAGNCCYVNADSVSAGDFDAAQSVLAQYAPAYNAHPAIFKLPSRSNQPSIPSARRLLPRQGAAVAGMACFD